MRPSIGIYLVIVGLAVFAVAGALTVSLNNARFLWMEVVPREERMLMTALSYLGLAVAFFGAGWAFRSRRSASRTGKENRIS